MAVSVVRPPRASRPLRFYSLNYRYHPRPACTSLTESASPQGPSDLRRRVPDVTRPGRLAMRRYLPVPGLCRSYRPGGVAEIISQAMLKASLQPHLPGRPRAVRRAGRAGQAWKMAARWHEFVGHRKGA